MTVVFTSTAVLAEDVTKQVTIAGVGFLYHEKTGQLTSFHFSVSHGLPRPVSAITFAISFRSPAGTVLMTERYRHKFQYEYQSKLVGAPLPRDEVYQVQRSPHVQGFCTGTCGTIQGRVIAVDTELELQRERSPLQKEQEMRPQREGGGGRENTAPPNEPATGGEQCPKGMYRNFSVGTCMKLPEWR